jgi:cytochrome P450
MECFLVAILSSICSYGQLGQILKFEILWDSHSYKTIKIQIQKKQMRYAKIAASAHAHSDLLSLLIDACDEDGGTMTDQQIHDEVMTMFLAGHETSAVLLSWAVVLLAIHPEIQEAAATEVDAVFNGEPLRSEHLPQLRVVKAVVQETLRLYPAVWSIGRNVVRDTTLGGLP